MERIINPTKWLQRCRCRGVGAGLLPCSFSPLRITHFVLPAPSYLPLISRLCGPHRPSNYREKWEAGEVWESPDAAGAPPWSWGLAGIGYVEPTHGIQDLHKGSRNYLGVYFWELSMGDGWDNTRLPLLSHFSKARIPVSMSSISWWGFLCST